MTARLDELVFRSATVPDAGRLAAVMVEGFETYRSFAPPDWQGPLAEEIAADLATRLETPTVWCQLAEDPARVAGYVSLLPADESRKPVGDPRLGHFWMLFVRAPWWGTGLADRLHGAACDAAPHAGLHRAAALHPGRPGTLAALLRAQGLDRLRRPVSRRQARHADRRVPPRALTATRPHAASATARSTAGRGLLSTHTSRSATSAWTGAMLAWARTITSARGASPRTCSASRAA